MGEEYAVLGRTLPRGLYSIVAQVLHRHHRPTEFRLSCVGRCVTLEKSKQHICVTTLGILAANITPSPVVVKYYCASMMNQPIDEDATWKFITIQKPWLRLQARGSKFIAVEFVSAWAKRYIRRGGSGADILITLRT